MTQISIYRRARVLAATALTGSLAVLGPQAALAQETEQTASNDEILVTATRRAQDVTTIPYNISALGSESLEAAGIDDVQDLGQVVPNLSLNTAGARSLGAQRPIIRGLNASASARPGQVLEQAPVATYLGNVPTGGDFPIDDIERVEVLRGPQGTIYGAGTLGGAIRIIPVSPKLGVFEGTASVSIGQVAHSKDQDYKAAAIVNLPLGNTLALRLSAKHNREAGFTDLLTWKRQGDQLSPPVLATPGDVAGSSVVLEEVPDFNWTRTTSGRASLRWEPSSQFDVELALNLVDIRGQGGPVDNPTYAGGPDPLDPRVVYPDTGKHEVIARNREPFDRSSQLGSADISYDAGFATLSSTTSYYETEGYTLTDSTNAALTMSAAALTYYAGDPVNPRFNHSAAYEDDDRVFTQELRIVSNGDGAIDYVVGAFYQKQTRKDDWLIYIPGARAQSEASGGNVIQTAANDLNFDLFGVFKFQERALFGDVTWHITPEWQVTGGARVFRQKYSRSIDSNLYVFGLETQNSNAAKASDATFKLNTSYEFAPRHQAYATFSQGFRRGGVNAFATAGFLLEPEALLSYRSDTVDNYEAGVKGRFSNGTRYSANVFYDIWRNPQIGLFTPVNLWAVVTNGSRARSVGVEFELSGDIGPRLSYNFGYAYADAKLTEDFCVSVGDGGGGIIECGINGLAGGRLPGAPKHSASATLDYTQDIFGDAEMTASLNANYKSSVLTSLPSANMRDPLVPSTFLVNARLGVERGPWMVSLQAENLLDSRAVQSSVLRIADRLGTLNQIDTIARPRTVSLGLRYTW